MRYVSFFLENYKGIGKKLDFNIENASETPLCIIGNNESGKTTILQGIELIGELCEGRKLDNGERNKLKPKGDYFTGVVKLGSKIKLKRSIVDSNGILKKYLENVQDEIDLMFEFSYTFERALFDDENTKISFGGLLITEEESAKEIHRLVTAHAQDVIYYDDFKFRVPEKIRFFSNQKNSNTDALINTNENKHWQTILDDILKGHDTKAKGFQEDVVDWYHDPEKDSSIADSRLRNMGKYLDKILTEWIRDNNNINNFEISKITPTNEKESVFSDYKIEIISGDNGYKMDERSKGLQWSFCFHILTSIRKNRHDTGFIFLLDEPASNLHIRPQNEMLNHLNKLCDTTSTVVYSTHSPELIGVADKCFQHTYVAKNNSSEFGNTDIVLYKLTDENINIEIQDIEPILAKLSFEDVKQLAKKNTTKDTDDKSKWVAIKECLSDTFDKAASISDKANKFLKLVPFLEMLLKKLM